MTCLLPDLVFSTRTTPLPTNDNALDALVVADPGMLTLWGDVTSLRFLFFFVLLFFVVGRGALE